MPLVRLEVENFKSYKGKQIIGPFYSFSAVIGPNGSGKSNLMDAISFVLGVKSAQLRSSQLKDLIYRGGKASAQEGEAEEDEESELSEEEDDATTRKGAASSSKRASVTAVYRDGKAIEHKFTRSITLAGSSEYRINGKAMPYAQYNARLEQHNILVKAKNFLVFQGDVEAVASQNAKDLSLLVDRISGSADLREEYDQAKEAMDKATENSTFNFNRRRNINSELKQFKEQKSEAERYEKLLDDKDAQVLHQLLWKLYHIEHALETQKETIDEKNDQLDELRAAQESEEERVTEARRDVGKVQKDMLAQEKKLKTAQQDLAEKQPELDAEETRISYSQRTLKNADDLIKRVEADLTKHTAAVEKLQRDKERVQEAADEAAEEARQAAEQSGLTLSDEDMHEYQELQAVAQARVATERQELESMKREIRAKKEAISNLEDKLAHLRAQKERLQEEESEQTTRLDLAGPRIQTLEGELGAVRAEVDAQQGERQRIQSREVQVNKSLQECYSKLLAAGHQQRESEKEAKLRETIATLQKIFPGVRGRIVDLCEPTQRKYDTAISIVLGRHSDSIVVDSEKTAISCIEYMRTQRVGQATFIPLDTIQVKPINDRLRSIAKGARLAVDIVKYQPHVQRAIQHACGNALVCDSMAIAREICYERKQEVKAVTLEGTVIHKSGLITGGQSGQGTAKRWEEKELQALHKQREECIAELRDLQRQKRNLGSDDEVTAKIGQIEAELASARDEQRAATGKQKGVRDEARVVDAQIEELQPELEQLQSAAAEADERASGLRATVEDAQDHVFAQFCARIGVSNIREYEESQLKVLESQNEAKLQFETQLLRLSHQLKFEQQTLASVEDRMKQLNKVRSREERKITDAESKKAEIEAELEEIRERIDEAKVAMADLRTKHDAAREAYQTAKREAQGAFKAFDLATKTIASCNDMIEKLAAERVAIYRRCRLEDIVLPLLKGSLSKVPLLEAGAGGDEDEDAMNLDVDDTTATVAKDYGIRVSFNELSEDEKDDGSAQMESKLQQDLEDVEAEIARMAPNMRANERLGDTEARLEETTREFDKARRESKEARDEFLRIKKLRCDMFNKAYNHISERIDQVYKELTKGKAAPVGGIAYLSLEDTEEPYLSGIKYHAMPPMKRFRDMDQLSGGEKTMAALALLFAIHSYQPAPFFVLDEVDAALDSQNVAKVSNYIRQHASDAFQFIVISLKASLYERSQALVGIYRDQEENSSATLTLDLERYS